MTEHSNVSQREVYTILTCHPVFRGIYAKLPKSKEGSKRGPKKGLINLEVRFILLHSPIPAVADASCDPAAVHLDERLEEVAHHLGAGHQAPHARAQPHQELRQRLSVLQGESDTRIMVYKARQDEAHLIRATFEVVCFCLPG